VLDGQDESLARMVTIETINLITKGTMNGTSSGLVSSLRGERIGPQGLHRLLRK
jgi:hypothetical protein